MTTFFFVRHGVTSHTGHKLTGWMPDVHLTEDGIKQAEAAAQALASVPLKAVYSSPIDRTLETAKIVAAPHKLDVAVRADLGEVQYGKWTNRSIKSLARTKLWDVVQRWPSGARFPDGETLLEVQHRVVTELDKIRAEHPKRAVACASHSDVIKLTVAHYLGVHIDLFQRIEVSPASITVIAVGDGGPRVLAVNATPASSPKP